MKIEPGEPAYDPAEWREGDAERHWQRGLELFRAGEYEEAHEEIERLWLSTEGADSDFYKGLIQACIALHHFQRGNLEGAAKLYGGHRRYLAAYLPAHRGLDLAAFLEEMRRCFEPVLRRTPGNDVRFDPARRPRLGP
jgi:predicted metal-dependent hydrolase